MVGTARNTMVWHFGDTMVDMCVNFWEWNNCDIKDNMDLFCLFYIFYLVFVIKVILWSKGRSVQDNEILSAQSTWLSQSQRADTNIMPFWSNK